MPKHIMVTITVNACLLVFYSSVIPLFIWPWMTAFHVYVLEFQTIFPCVFKTIWMCFAVARVWKSVDQWTFSVCKDVPQHKPRTTGEFRNLEWVSDLLSFPRDMPSPKTRTWARHILSTSKVEDVNFEALAMQQREALNISCSFWESETCQGTFDLQHLAHYISSNSGWQWKQVAHVRCYHMHGWQTRLSADFVRNM